MNVSTASVLSLREILTFYYRYRARLLGTFWGVLAVAVAVSFVPVPRYTATGVLIVRLGSEYVYQPETGANLSSAQPSIPFNRDQIFKTEAAILDSADLHRQVVESVDAAKLYPDLFESNWQDSLIAATPDELARYRLAKAIARFDKRLTITLEKDSAVLHVAFSHADAAMAVKTLENLLNLYLEKRRDLYREPRIQLAQKQADDAHERAQTAARAVQAFKTSYQIYSLPDERASLISQRADIDRQRAVVNSPVLDDKIAFYNEQLDRLDRLEHQLNGLQHDAQVANDEYAIFAHQLGEAKALEALQRERIGGVRIIQSPTAPPEPQKLQPLILVIGFIVSVLATFGVAIVTDLFSSGFLTPERLERELGLPVLATLSHRRNHSRHK